MRGQDRQEETVERLEPLGAGSGAADIEYEQFMKAKEVQRAMFQARLLRNSRDWLLMLHSLQFLTAIAYYSITYIYIYI